MVSAINKNLKVFDILIKVVSSMLSDRNLYVCNDFYTFCRNHTHTMLQIVALIEKNELYRTEFKRMILYESSCLLHLCEWR